MNLHQNEQLHKSALHRQVRIHYSIQSCTSKREVKGAPCPAAMVWNVDGTYWHRDEDDEWSLPRVFSEPDSGPACSCGYKSDRSVADEFDRAWAQTTDAEALFTANSRREHYPSKKPRTDPGQSSLDCMLKRFRSNDPKVDEQSAAAATSSASSGSESSSESSSESFISLCKKPVAKEMASADIVVREPSEECRWDLSESSADEDCGAPPPGVSSTTRVATASSTSSASTLSLGKPVAVDRSHSPKRRAVEVSQPSRVKPRLTLGPGAWQPKDPDPLPGCGHWQIPLWNSIKTARMKLPQKVRKLVIESLCAGMATELMGCKELHVLSMISIYQLTFSNLFLYYVYVW